MISLSSPFFFGREEESKARRGERGGDALFEGKAATVLQKYATDNRSFGILKKVKWTFSDRNVRRKMHGLPFLKKKHVELGFVRGIFFQVRDCFCITSGLGNGRRRLVGVTLTTIYARGPLFKSLSSSSSTKTDEEIGAKKSREGGE